MQHPEAATLLRLCCGPSVTAVVQLAQPGSMLPLRVALFAPQEEAEAAAVWPWGQSRHLVFRRASAVAAAALRHFAEAAQAGQLRWGESEEGDGGQQPAVIEMLLLWLATYSVRAGRKPEHWHPLTNLPLLRLSCTARCSLAQQDASPLQPEPNHSPSSPSSLAGLSACHCLACLCRTCSAGPARQQGRCWLPTRKMGCCCPRCCAPTAASAGASCGLQLPTPPAVLRTTQQLRRRRLCGWLLVDQGRPACCFHSGVASCICYWPRRHLPGAPS